MSNQIIFIAGLQRSGTTLLATILGKHPMIFAEPRAIGFRLVTNFKNMYELLPHNLQHDQNEFLKWLMKNDKKGRLKDFLDYENLEKHGTIQNLIKSSIHQKLATTNKQIWLDKTPNMQHYISDLKLLIPEAKVIHIVRDGRANAQSIAKRSYKNLQLAAQTWVDGNVHGLINQQILGVENYKIIQYENLLQSPETEIKQLCKFLEIPFDKAMLDLRTDKRQEENSYVKWAFDTSKIDNWKQVLSPREIQQVECIQGPLLQKFGYELSDHYHPKEFRLLSLWQQIFYNQSDNFKSLFRRKQAGMRQGEIIEIKIPLKHRIYSFLTVLVRDFVKLNIFKQLFSSYFYDKKYMTDDK